MIKRLLSLVLALTRIVCALLMGQASAQTACCVTQMVSDMSLRDKVTQMLMVDFRQWGAADFTVMNDEVRQIIQDYNFGSILLFSNNIRQTGQAYQLTMAMQEAATKDGGIPLLIAADQEGGSVYRLGSGTALPGNMALGATYAANGTQYAYEAGKIIGSELAALGIAYSANVKASKSLRPKVSTKVVSRSQSTKLNSVLSVPVGALAKSPQPPQ